MNNLSLVLSFLLSFSLLAEGNFNDCHILLSEDGVINYAQIDFRKFDNFKTLVENQISQKIYNKRLTIPSLQNIYIRDLLFVRIKGLLFNTEMYHNRSIAELDYLLDRYSYLKSIRARTADLKRLQKQSNKADNGSFHASQWETLYYPDLLTERLLHGNSEDFRLYATKLDRETEIDFSYITHAAFQMRMISKYFTLIKIMDRNYEFENGMGTFVKRHEKQFKEFFAGFSPHYQQEMVSKLARKLIEDGDLEHLEYVVQEYQLKMNDLLDPSMGNSFYPHRQRGDVTLLDHAIYFKNDLIKNEREGISKVEAVIDFLKVQGALRKLELIPSQEQIRLLKNQKYGNVFYEYNYVFNYLAKEKDWDNFFKIVRYQLKAAAVGGTKSKVVDFNFMVSELKDHQVEIGLEIIRRLDSLENFKLSPIIFTQSRFFEELNQQGELLVNDFLHYTINKRSYDQLRVLNDFIDNGIKVPASFKEWLEADLDQLWQMSKREKHHTQKLAYLSHIMTKI